MIEGYNALDGPAGLAFAIIVINAIRSYGITDKKSIVKYTIFSGLGAAFFFSSGIFYAYLCRSYYIYFFFQWRCIVTCIDKQFVWKCWGVILGIAVLLGCLTTSIGLTTAFSDYFKELFPSVSYKRLRQLFVYLVLLSAMLVYLN